MAYSTIDALNSIGDFRIVLFSPPEKEFRENQKVNPYKNVKIVCQEKNLKEKILPVFQTILYKFSKRNRFLEKGIFKYYKNCDLVLDLNGDSYSSIYKKATYRACLKILIAHALKKEIVFLPQSFGPFETTFSKMFFKYTLKRVNKIFYRERYTKKLLEDLKIENCYFFYDSAFYLNHEESEKNRKKIKQNDKRTVGVCLSESISDYSRKSSDYQKYINIFHNFISEFDKSFNFILIPHVYQDWKAGKDDRLIHRKLKKSLEENNRIAIDSIEEDLNPRELKWLISQCDFFIGSRMHSNIAALSMDTPCIAISYSHKYKGIMEIFSMGKYVIEFCDLEFQTLNSKFQQLLLGEENIINNLKKINQKKSSYKTLLRNIVES